MSFDWLEYLHLAQNLAGQTIVISEQAKLRSAISRAYYAAFHQAKRFLENKEHLTIPLQNVHKFVINQFQNYPDPVRQKIGNRLQVLRGYRNQADYEESITITIKTCQESLILARRIILSIDGL